MSKRLRCPCDMAHFVIHHFGSIEVCMPNCSDVHFAYSLTCSFRKSIMNFLAHGRCVAINTYNLYIIFRLVSASIPVRVCASHAVHVFTHVCAIK